MLRGAPRCWTAAREETAGLAYDRARRLRRRGGPAAQHLGAAARREADGADPGPRLRRPRPGLQPGLARHGRTTWGSTATPSLVTRRPAAGRRGLPDPDRRWIPTLPPVALEDWPVAEAARGTTPSRPSATGAATARSSTRGALRPDAPTVRRLARPAGPARRAASAGARDRPGRGGRPARPARARLGAARPRRGRRTPGRLPALRSRLEGRSWGSPRAGYVDARCGWFSDRSACYLASGRPVVAQDTGFGCALPAGEGLLAFAAREAADAVAP